MQLSEITAICGANYRNKSQPCAVSPQNLNAELDSSVTEVKLTHVFAILSGVISSKRGMSSENDGNNDRNHIRAILMKISSLIRVVSQQFLTDVTFAVGQEGL